MALVVASPALADDAEYQIHYDRAREMVSTDDLRGAVVEFQAALAASPKPEPLFNVGLIYRKLAGTAGSAEDARNAIDHFERYLSAYKALHGQDPDDAAKIRGYVEEMRQQTQPRPIEPVPSVEPRSGPTRSSGTKLRRGPVIGLAIAAASMLVVGAIVYGIAAASYGSTVPACTPRCSSSDLEPIEAAAFTSYGLLGVGGVLAAVDVALWSVFAAQRTKDRRRKVSTAPGLGALSVRGEW